MIPGAITGTTFPPLLPRRKQLRKTSSYAKILHTRSLCAQTAYKFSTRLRRQHTRLPSRWKVCYVVIFSRSSWSGYRAIRGLRAMNDHMFSLSTNPPTLPGIYGTKEERDNHHQTRSSRLQAIRMRSCQLSSPSHILLRRDTTYICQAQTNSLPCGMLNNYKHKGPAKSSESTQIINTPIEEALKPPNKK